MAEAVPPGKKYLLGERKSILLGEILDVWEMYLFRNSHQMRTFIGPKFGWVFFRNFSNHVVCVASDGRKPNQDHCLLPSQSLPGGGGAVTANRVKMVKKKQQQPLTSPPPLNHSQ